MKRTRISLATLGTVALLTLPAAIAQSPSGRQEPPDKPGKTLQTFHGKVDAVDTNAKTMTIGGQLIYVTDTTRISKQGKSIQLSDLAAGDTVHGTSQMTFDGKTEALTVLVMAKPKDAPPEKP